MPADPNRVRDIFLAAVELVPEQRPIYLDEACQNDVDLRVEVDRLLVANAAPDSNLELPTPTLAVAASAFQPAITTEKSPLEAGNETVNHTNSDATTAAGSSTVASLVASSSAGKDIGTVIAGRYTLVEVIGEGGMGSVYRASQSDPVKRQVALKLIKPGWIRAKSWPDSTPNVRRWR